MDYSFISKSIVEYENLLSDPENAEEFKISRARSIIEMFSHEIKQFSQCSNKNRNRRKVNTLTRKMKREEDEKKNLENAMQVKTNLKNKLKEILRKMRNKLIQQNMSAYEYTGKSDLKLYNIRQCLVNTGDELQQLKELIILDCIPTAALECKFSVDDLPLVILHSYSLGEIIGRYALSSDTSISMFYVEKCEDEKQSIIAHEILINENIQTSRRKYHVMMLPNYTFRASFNSSKDGIIFNSIKCTILSSMFQLISSDHRILQIPLFTSNEWQLCRNLQHKCYVDIEMMQVIAWCLRQKRNLDYMLHFSIFEFMFEPLYLKSIKCILKQIKNKNKLPRVHL